MVLFNSTLDSQLYSLPNKKRLMAGHFCILSVCRHLAYRRFVWWIWQRLGKKQEDSAILCC